MILGGWEARSAVLSDNCYMRPLAICSCSSAGSSPAASSAASVGVFDLLRAVAMAEDMRMPLRKVVNGVIGGVLGGLVGGVVYGLVSNLEFLPHSGSGALA